jgi:putative nucleotidyltransferase with HDIG domain
VTYLGFQMVRSLVMMLETFTPPEGVSKEEVESLRSHAVCTARIAARLVTERQTSEDAFLAGLLHDVGRLVLPKGDQADHGAAGAYLLGLWGLPWPIVEAVAHHHDPARAEPTRFDVLAAVHVADALARRTDGQVECGLDLALLERLGVDHLLPEWEQIAAQVSAQETA